MIGSTAKSEQFRERVANESTKGSRKGYLLNAGGEDPVAQLTPEEQRGSLVAVVKNLGEQLSAAKAARQLDKVKELGQAICEVNAAINSIRPHTRSSDPFTIAQYFVDVCKEEMTKPQFHAILNEANRRQRVAMGLLEPRRVANGGI